MNPLDLAEDALIEISRWQRETWKELLTMLVKVTTHDVLPNYPLPRREGTEFEAITKEGVKKLRFVRYEGNIIFAEEVNT